MKRKQKSLPREIRMSADGCCVDTYCVHWLARRPIVKRKVHTCDGIKTKRLARLMWCDKEWFADLVTGTLFDPMTGRSSSPMLWLVME